MADKLKPLPKSPILPDGDEVTLSAYKRAKAGHKEAKAEVQRANQKIVSRAEDKLRRNFR